MIAINIVLSYYIRVDRTENERMAVIKEIEKKFVVLNKKNEVFWQSTKRVNCERLITRVLGKTINTGMDW